MTDFVAIDFETADHGADSACAIGLVRVSGGAIVERRVQLIRPPRPHFMFSYIHGIEWSDCSDKPSFAQLWPSLRPMLARASFLAAHNASFDNRVLRACCQSAGLDMPAQPFLCTVALARRTWKLRPTKLSDCCTFLGIELNHHEALSDAEACAKIVLAAARDGAELPDKLRPKEMKNA